MKNNMDYIYMAEDQKILIELMQESTRQSVIEQYVQCRKRQDMTQAELAEKLMAECVAVIGRKVILYRRSSRKNFEHIQF